MKWSDIPANSTPKVLRQFAGAWLLLFLAIGGYQGLAKGHWRWGITLAILAVVIGVLGLLKPPSVRWLFVTCTRLAFPIGWLISQLVLLVMFYAVLTPIALVFRLLGRDLLCRKLASGQTSYWISKETPRDLRRYFRQY